MIGTLSKVDVLKRRQAWMRVVNGAVIQENRNDPTLHSERDLYLQLVVIVWGDPRTPEIVSPENPLKQLKNYQLRYYLAGITEPPFVLINAKLQFVEKQSKPEMGTWVHFEIPVRADFQKLWGTVPEGYNRIRLLFEARWDNMPAGGSALADVYFDDLYFDYGP